MKIDMNLYNDNLYYEWYPDLIFFNLFWLEQNNWYNFSNLHQQHDIKKVDENLKE